MGETFNAKTVEQILKVMQARTEKAEAEVERLKGVLEFVDLNISKDNEAAKEAIRSALEAKP